MSKSAFESFKNPEKIYHGTDFWMLNDKLEADELVRQLKCKRRVSGIMLTDLFSVEIDLCIVSRAVKGDKNALLRPRFWSFKYFAIR